MNNYILMISEKPQASRRIAEALATSKVIKKENRGIYWFEFERKGKKHVCVPAVGHLFALDTVDTNGWNYPVFETKWVPSFLKRGSEFSRNYFKNIEELAKKASDFIVCCDYDIEGEVIGFNILRFLCNRNDAKRMKFSTLTKDELIESYENMMKHLDFGQAEAGLTRHYLDFIWGINTTRALTLALKSALKRGFAVVSTGRVQGPTLSIITQRELEIRNFKPVPFWQLELYCLVDGKVIVASYEKDKIWDKKEAEKVFNECKGKDAVITEIKKRKYKVSPPIPFDTTTLQTESYRCFGYSPTQTLNIAESLYTQGFISYPRTGSQKLPDKIGYKKILENLGKIKMFEKECEALLAKKELKPKEGKKSDPAHPAIYPTSQVPDLDKLTTQQKRVYELVVRRFLSVFGDPALRESMKVTLDVNKNNFIVTGQRTVKSGWTELYGKFATIKEQILPELKEGETLKVKELKMLDKETQPPGRYSQASVIKEMEKRGLGTKCLTGDCNIITSDFNEINLESMWKNSDFLCYNDGVEIRKLNTPISITLNEKSFDVEFIKPTLISKRKLKENERLLKIVTKGGDLKVTEDHPLYIYNDKIILKPAKDISKGEKLLSIILKNRFGKILVGENWFLKKDFKIRDGMYVHKFSSKKSLGISKDKLPIMWSSDLAWLLGYFFGDGSYNTPHYNGSHQIYFTTTEKKALKILRTRIKRIFGVTPKVYCIKNGRQYKVQCNAVISTLLADVFPEIKTKQKFNLPNEFVGDFLRGLFDADGNVHRRDIGNISIRGVKAVGHGVPRVKITLANKNIILWVKELLDKMGIKTVIHKESVKLGKKQFRCFTIRIGGRENVDKFAWKIGFDVDYKKATLYTGLLSDSLQYKRLKVCYDVVLALKKDELDKNGIIRVTNYSPYDIKEALKRLIKLKVVKRKRLSPYSHPPNRVLYKLVDNDYYLHALKANYNLISGDFYTSEVLKVEEIKPNDEFVYDISVLPTSPNFITNGAILVHNSTRAQILQTLYDRGYIVGKSIEVTGFGEHVTEVLNEYCPRILSEELTRKFEEEMELVNVGKKKREKIIEEAKKVLVDILEDFKKNEQKIGKGLSKAYIAFKEKQRRIGKCPQCGKDLIVIRSRRSGKRFVGCSGYKDGCRFSTPLPQAGMITTTDKTCKECGYPVIMVKLKGKRPFFSCINMKCPTKEKYQESKKKEKV